jgi:hypothetical protein
MGLVARFPRMSAWLMVLVILGATTLGTLQALHALEPAMPAHLERVHGIIVAIRAGEIFAVRVPGRTQLLWFRAAPDAPISMAHLWRHLHERAGTDIFYLDQGQGPLLAWIAD